MRLSSKMASFALAHTTDSWHAAELVDMLAGDLSLAHPKIGLPPQWVLYRQKGPVDMAVFAIWHCRDAATLATIATKAKRKSVLLALADNKYLPESGIITLHSVAQATGNADLRNALPDRTPPPPPTTPAERFAAFMAKAAGDPSVWGEKWVARHRLAAVACPLPTEMADAVLAALAQAGQTWGVTAVLEQSVQQIPHDPKNLVEYFDESSFSPLECLDMFPESMQATVLRNFVTNCVATHAAQVPLELTQRMTELVNVSRVQKGRSYRWRKLVNFFDDESIEYLLDQQVWCEALIHHELTAEQLDRLVVALGPDRWLRLLSRDPLDREVLLALLPRIEPGTLDNDDLNVGTARDVFTGPDDPLVQLYLRASDPAIRVDYLRGAWGGQDPIVPTLEVLREALLLDADPGGLSFERTLNQYDMDTHPHHARLMLDLARGFAWYNISHDAEGAYVYQRLMATGAPNELVFTMFDENGPTTSLDHLCATLARFAKLQD